MDGLFVRFRSHKWKYEEETYCSKRSAYTISSGYTKISEKIVGTLGPRNLSTAFLLQLCPLS